MGVGLFEDAEKKFEESLAIQKDNARALHGLARSLAARNRLDDALTTAQAALNKDPRDAEFHHTVGSIYERMRRYEEAANAYSSYINLLPNKDRSAKAAWARAEVRFLRAFGSRPPLEHRAGQRPGGCTRCPSASLNEKIIVKARVNRGPLMDFVLDTGSEQTVISRETARRMGIRPIVNILSAGVGDLGVRELELARLDELELGSLKVQNVPTIIKNPPLVGLPTREMESFSPLALGHVGDHRLRPAGAHHGRLAADRNGRHRAAVADASPRDGARARSGAERRASSSTRAARSSPSAPTPRAVSSAARCGTFR